MITPENMPSHEIIGLRAEIVQSRNPQIIGLNGTVINETKNMFVIDTGSGSKMIPKDVNTWRFSWNGAHREVHGALLARRPHERLARK